MPFTPAGVNVDVVCHGNDGTAEKRDPVAQHPQHVWTRRSSRNRIVTVVAVLLSVALLSSSAFADTRALTRELNDLVGERQAAERELAGARSSEQDARAALAEVERRLGAAQRRQAELADLTRRAEELYDTRLAEEADAQAEATRATEEADATELLLEEKHAQLEARVRAAFKYGHVGLVEVFSGVNDIADLISTSTFLAHVIEADRDLVNTVNMLLIQVVEQRDLALQAADRAVAASEEAAEAKAEVEAALAEQALITQEISFQVAERDAVFQRLRDDREAIEGHLSQLEAESQRIQQELAEIARRQEEERRRAEAEGREPPSFSDSGWIRPVQGRLTSPFGPRWGRNHNGVDLAGAVGSPVIAARSGIVVTAVSGCHPTSSWGCGGGFGNYITISHNDGFATIYAHLSALRVPVGTVVGAGEEIGHVGNSGNSYGPHLHFETRQVGVPRNPCNYINC